MTHIVCGWVGVRRRSPERQREPGRYGKLPPVLGREGRKDKTVETGVGWME